MRHDLLSFLFHLFPTISGMLDKQYQISFGYERDSWTPLTLTEALDYYTLNDLSILLRIPAILPLPHCKEASLCDSHHFSCSSKEKLSLFMRHKSTTSSPIETWKMLIHEVKSQGTNTILLIGDSLSLQHAVDAVFLTESAGYEFTLLKEHGGEIVIQIEKAVVENSVGEKENSSVSMSNRTNTSKDKKIYPYFLVIIIGADDRNHAFRDNLQQLKTAYQTKIEGSPLVIANYGLRFNSWENEKEEYRKNVELFLETIDHGITALHGTILYRETSAQHFHSPTGEYRPDYTKLKCAPFENITESNYHAFNWKNMVVEEVLKTSQYTHSFITIPFFNLTVPLYDLHAADGVGGDCTHYCQLSGRLVWAPVWSTILSVIQKYGNATV